MIARNSTSDTVPPTTVRWQVWTGRVLAAIPALMLVMSASMKLGHQPQVLDMFVGKYGYSAGALSGLALVELMCSVTYVVPQTAVLGAILLTGYLGGAIATHVRVEESFTVPLLLGVVVWVSLFLRDERLRGLLPLRSLPR